MMRRKHVAVVRWRFSFRDNLFDATPHDKVPQPHNIEPRLENIITNTELRAQSSNWHAHKTYPFLALSEREPSTP